MKSNFTTTAAAGTSVAECTATNCTGPSSSSSSDLLDVFTGGGGSHTGAPTVATVITLVYGLIFVAGLMGNSLMVAYFSRADTATDK